MEDKRTEYFKYLSLFNVETENSLCLDLYIRLKRNNGFSSLSLTEIVIPEGVEEIEENEFIGQIKLKKVVLPKSLKKIGELAFAHTGIENISIGDDVIVEDNAFFETPYEEIKKGIKV